MNTQPANDLRDFHLFVGQKITNGGPAPSPEEVLDEWRNLHPDADETVAIQEAIDDLESGDSGMTFDEFDRAFRARHNLPPKS